MPDRLLQFDIISRGLKFYREHVSMVAISVLLLGLVGYASNETLGLFYISMAAAVAMGLSFHRMFGAGSAFFNVLLANVITIYLCFFAFFVDSIFPDLGQADTTIGFLIPLAAFLAGAIHRRQEITDIVQAQGYIHEKKFIRSFLWLIPMAVIGVSAFTLHQAHENTPEHIRNFFLMEMSAIAAVVFFASRDFTLMLIDTGMLFGSFFASNAKLIKPAFAFFTLYSLIVIVFGAIYRIIDYISKVHHFAVHGTERDLTFVESLYYSLVTVSTLGFGDILPLTNAMRFLTGVQSFLGTLLFLIGVHAIMTHTREEKTGGR